MAGQGFMKGMMLTLRHFVESYVEDFRYGLRRYAPDVDNFQVRQGVEAEGVKTVMYPEEKLAVPERFRFVPFLVVQDHDDELNPSKDWCTSCGICAKVCPPQCIWIVRSDDPVTGKPVPEPEAFFIDIDICMNCGFCAEFCPFDAIKMDHDYELASYDRTTNHVFDKPKLSKELRYWNHIAPTRAEEERDVRGSANHKNFQKSWVTTKAEAQAAREAQGDKRDEVRSRKAEAQAEAKSDIGDGPLKIGQPGKAPWEESHELREARAAAALRRKAVRASRRTEQN
ncbi:MAG: 4Fe-4S binding protein [Phototrophicaceae bacterium]